MAYQAVPLGRASASGIFFLMASTWMLLLSIFHAFPAMDIAVSSFFFRGPLCGGNAGCGGFVFSRYESVILLRWVLYVLPYLAAAAVISVIGDLSLLPILAIFTIVSLIAVRSLQSNFQAGTEKDFR